VFPFHIRICRFLTNASNFFNCARYGETDGKSCRLFCGKGQGRPAIGLPADPALPLDKTTDKKSERSLATLT
ncbi:MAG: hypothetical protein SVY10_12145, partial [Thermodesulfobacteriota bacterium]|nr:hypothetical protein [Thermodesulfobacteriota bacterium]